MFALIVCTVFFDSWILTFELYFYQSLKVQTHIVQYIHPQPWISCYVMYFKVGETLSILLSRVLLKLYKLAINPINQSKNTSDPHLPLQRIQ